MAKNTTALRPYLAAFAGFVCLMIAIGFGRFAYAPLLPLMQQEQLISVAGAGVLGSLHFLGYWLGAASAGRSWVRSRDGLVIFLSLIALATALMMVQSFELWVLMRLLTGVLSGWVFVLVSHVFINHQLAGFRYLQNVVLSGVGVGIVLVAGYSLFVASHGIPSLEAWLYLGLFAGVMLLPLMNRLKMPGEIGVNDTLTMTATNHRIDWPLVSAYGVCGLGYVIPATYLPLIAEQASVKSWLFGLSWLVFGVAATASVWLAGHILKHCSERKLWSFCHCVMGVGMIVPAFYNHWLAYLITGVTVGGTFLMVTLAAIREAGKLKGHEAYRCMARLTMAFGIGQSVGPILASLTHQLLGSFTLVLVVTSVMLWVTSYTLIKNPLPCVKEIV